ncbi:site-specific integrase [Nonomuraea sp. NPDC004186]
MPTGVGQQTAITGVARAGTTAVRWGRFVSRLFDNPADGGGRHGGSGHRRATRPRPPALPPSRRLLADLANAGASARTRRAYRGDLIAFAAHHGEEVAALTATPIRAYLAELADLSPSSRKRKRAVVASFCKWAVRHDLLQADPMDRIDTVAHAAELINAGVSIEAASATPPPRPLSCTPSWTSVGTRSPVNRAESSGLP